MVVHLAQGLLSSGDLLVLSAELLVLHALVCCSVPSIHLQATHAP